jgi:hypothetical protein
MLLTQYAVPLPADYDMGIIRGRVRENGSKMDGFPGLGLKAYLIQEKGVRGADINQYAPFYRWDEVDAAARFFFGGLGFGGIVRDFGRPAVRTWIEGRCHAMADPVGRARFATTSTLSLPPHSDPTDAAMRAESAMMQIFESEGVALSLFGIDPERWETVHLTLWSDEPEPESGQVYEVLHVSGPAH